MKAPPLRRAAGLIVFGLLVQLVSLAEVHPMSFIAFAVLGAGPVVLGMVDYLVSVLRSPQ